MGSSKLVLHTSCIVGGIVTQRQGLDLSHNMWGQVVTICFLASIPASSSADNNFLTGANDIIAVIDEDGDIKASPFNVQFGKKDIWLPRAGHVVSLEVNKIAALSRIKGLFPGNPFFSGFGNKAWDILAYK